MYLAYLILYFSVWNQITSLSLERYSKSSRPGLFLGKGALKICSKFTGERPYRSVISIKLLCNLIEIEIRHGCSFVNLLYIFRTPFPKNTSGRLLLVFVSANFEYHKMAKKEKTEKMRMKMKKTAYFLRIKKIYYLVQSFQNPNMIDFIRYNNQFLSYELSKVKSKEQR